MRPIFKEGEEATCKHVPKGGQKAPSAPRRSARGRSAKVPPFVCALHQTAAFSLIQARFPMHSCVADVFH
jgi:hypothetical protein